MESVLITGGTGMIGSALAPALVRNGFSVVILTRRARPSLQEGVSYSEWDPVQERIDDGLIGRADYIIHLAGANVAQGRWTAKRKKEIIESRVKSGALIAKLLNEVPNHVKAVCSSSAIGYYGPDRNTGSFMETDPPDHDFLSQVVQQWEAAIRPAASAVMRLVVFRTGIVLSNEGGAYPEFKKPLRAGVAAILGSGNQVVSWIHIDDLVRLYLEALRNQKWNGVYNAVTPAPVSNRQLIAAMAATKRFAVPLRIPAFVLKTVLGEMSIEVLKSTTVSASKLMEQGFRFQYPTVEEAIRKLEAS